MTSRYHSEDIFHCSSKYFGTNVPPVDLHSISCLKGLIPSLIITFAITQLS